MKEFKVPGSKLVLEFFLKLNIEPGTNFL